MDRKNFIRTTGLGVGFTLLPLMTQCQTSNDDDYQIMDTEPKIITEAEGSVLNVIGDIQTHKLTGNDTGNQIVEWVSNVEPGVGIPPHIHTLEDEIFRVLKGQVEIMVNGQASILNAGDVAFAPKNIPHAWTVVGTDTAQMICSAFPSGIENMFDELAELPAGPPDFDKVAEICSRHGISFV